MKLTRSVENGNLSPKQKIEMLCSFFVSSGIGVNSIVRNDSYGTTDFQLTLPSGEALLVHAIIKNISNSGWSWKPFVKRIQVKTFADKKLPAQSKKEIVLLGGFSLVDGDYVFAAWNIFAYMSQNTVRSCYIDIDNLIDGKDKGLLSVLYAHNRVYICDKTHVNELLMTFQRHNAITKI